MDIGIRENDLPVEPYVGELYTVSRPYWSNLGMDAQERLHEYIEGHEASKLYTHELISFDHVFDKIKKS